MTFQPIFNDNSGDTWQKAVKIGKNTEGVDKRTKTDKKRFRTIFGIKWSKLAKILRGVNKRTKTDLINISGDIWQKVVKISKNTEGV